MVTIEAGRYVYTGADAQGSLAACIRADCNNPDRLWAPCPSKAHELEDCTDFEQPRRPAWWHDPVSDAQLDTLYKQHADMEWTAEELAGLTKGEASQLIQTYREDPIN